ncbi:hypothetical protein SPRG_16812 [Saprolegnia parasitica CBS 223.65]|uniref:Uncharacterized protein n=1 Tax=Saprolegnia parasitica (strain CBS 223.65) TaxID=695850 RepID=A0A067BLP9_SAPPC|nr:hypothetical protein SPRG_16812 [Saprolegnia parasitica CBS 223.65]KDO17640.1 hypothetical protein SPRG_16812 [Saprolegnia parasitica CBS 223.65]|eukprot:XP_012211651.1 hypothetical protein SPRG_16812 [Saprolegnia parasitica CBS 223.65]
MTRANPQSEYFASNLDLVLVLVNGPRERRSVSWHAKCHHCGQERRTRDCAAAKARIAQRTLR